MEPIFIESIYDSFTTFEELLKEVPWEKRDDAPRKECFMSENGKLTYTYGRNVGERTYYSIGFTDTIKKMIDDLNKRTNNDYNVCFLNYYENEKMHLGWHSDDSPEMDNNHPIAVITFGEPREIWWKEKGVKGELPDENKKLLTNGSLFIMPKGFQENHVHKIPKGSKQNMGGRISLTFRRFSTVKK